jgi:FAD/FMN-containing dehydrogenase
MATPTTSAPATYEEFALTVRGRLVSPDAADYDEMRAVYNAMIDVRPQMIARCTDIADVVSAVNFARGNNMKVAIRGGGHNGGGLGTCDGLVIDLAEMHGVHVDPVHATATVEGGATLGLMDHAASAYGLATPAGIISTTGVGGLTLGGGLGHLTRKYGLTIDNLLSADVVLADGRIVTADADHEPDLFWALRGGGGNFGVVTSFTFAMHPVSEVIAGPMLWPLDRAAEILTWYRDFMPAQPEDLNAFFAFMTVPPGPPFPESLWMQKMCGIVACWAGPADGADAALAPARALAPALDGVGPMPYPVLQSAFDALYPRGQQWYWRADFVDTISDEAIARHVEFAHLLPTPQSTMHLYPIDGAVHRVAPDATAFAYRDANWAQTIVGVDPDPANARAITEWTVAYHDALHPHAAGGAYVNMMMDEGQERVQASYRGNYQRLTEVKGRYDPDNLFHVNQNIRPAAANGAAGNGASGNGASGNGAAHN